MSFVGLRSAIISSIDSEVSAFKVVEAHGGTFNADEIKRVGKKVPAALVAMFGGPITREGGVATCEARVVVFVMTRGSSATLRDAAVLALVESVAGLANQNTWNYSDAQAPDGMQIANLFTGDVDRMGVALWSVSWTQALDIDTFSATDYAALPYFHTLHVDWDLDPVDGQIDAEQLIQVMGEFMSAYAHSHIETAIATSVAVAGTYVKAAGTTELKLSEDCDMPVTGRLRHIGTVAKPFSARASGSISVDTDGEVKIALAKGGTVDEDTAQIVDVTIAEGAKPFTVDGVFSLDENEYVEVWVTADDAMGVTFENSNFVIGAT